MAVVRAVILLALGANPVHAMQRPVDQRTRADLRRELAALDDTLRSRPDDVAARVRHGKLLYHAGEFWRARDLLASLAEARSAADEALELGARLEFLTGRYDRAEALYDRLIAARADDVSKQVAAKVGKMLVYYQQDQFDRIAALDFPAGVQLPTYTLAKAFDRPPYRVEWHGEEKVAEVPFYALDPLPQFSIEVNGVPLNVLFDTGADALIIDDEVAEALAIRSVTTVKGTFGGGLQSDVGFGKVGRVKIGQVSLHDVPVMILATKRFTFDPKYPLSAIVGTAFMRQFLGTIDYRNRKIVLRERTPDNARAARRRLGSRLVAEIRFVLDATHMMHARGGINREDDLTFFIDSGLAMDAVLTAPVQTLRFLRIPEPPLKMDSGVGGGGGKYPTGTFAMETVRLGPLEQKKVQGQLGSRPPQSYWERGFIADALLSHGFLKRYGSWTIDFDSMSYLFER